jgi:DNA modification methylase
MTKINWKVEKRKVKELKTWSKNPRRISPENLTKLKERIEQRGFHDVVKIDTDGVILSGNQRKKALIDLGITEVTVLIPDRKLTEEEKDKIALESNISDGTWDYDGLKDFDLGLLTDVGFDSVELSKSWNENLENRDDDFNESEELAKIKVPKTKLGDLVILGQHKILCADSTDPNALKKLFGEDRAAMIYSDPVYNLNYNYKSGLGGSKNYGGEVNDKRTDTEYAELIKKSMIAALAVTKTDAHVFYWSDSSYIWLMQTLYRELGIENKRICLWLKQSQNPTPGVAFSKCYEPCTYGVRGKPYLAKHIQNLNEVMNGEMTTGNDLFEQALDVWAIRRLSGKEMEHATSKPPQLHTKAIGRCSKVGDIILDSFLGSASTLISAEQLKRRVYGVELQPVYVDLAIRRFEKLTGTKAKIIHNYYEKE